MAVRSKAKRFWWLWLALVVVAAIAVVLYRVGLGRPSFDADMMAQAETKMWQAYYSGDRTQIGLQLIALLRNQHGMTLLEAKRAGESFAQAAMKFRSAREHYDAVALGDMTAAYDVIRQASGASYDSQEAARAELAWWVARRTPGQDSAEQVGAKIAELYAVLYGRADPAFEQAGVLRAQAAILRDSGGSQADWPEVQNLLTDSYRILAGI